MVAAIDAAGRRRARARARARPTSPPNPPPMITTAGTRASRSRGMHDSMKRRLWRRLHLTPWPNRRFARRDRGADPSSTPPVRSTVPTAAVSTSRSSAAGSRRSTDRRRRRRPTATSAARSGSSIAACITTSASCIRPSAQGRKGTGEFSRVTWDEALDLIAGTMREARDRFGAESVLPYHYGGSNGVLTNDFADARFFRRFGASRLARTLCAAPTGAAATAMYGKMAGVAYDDYEHAKLIVVWGCNPSATGIHLVSHIKRAQKNGARLVVIDPRRTPLARIADLHLPVRPGTDLPVALSLDSRAVRARPGRSRRSSTTHTTRRRRTARGGRAVDDRSRRRGSRRRRRRSARRSPSGTARPRPPSSAAAGARSAIATAAARRWPFWRCRPWPASSACAAAATR